jgi:hypothetical protein
MIPTRCVSQNQGRGIRHGYKNQGHGMGQGNYNQGYQYPSHDYQNQGYPNQGPQNYVDLDERVMGH